MVAQVFGRQGAGCSLMQLSALNNVMASGEQAHNARDGSPAGDSGLSSLRLSASTWKDTFVSTITFDAVRAALLNHYRHTPSSRSLLLRFFLTR